MADYRHWCRSCGNEIGFGGHKDGCPVVAEARAAEKTKRDFETQLWQATSELTDEKIYEEALESGRKLSYLGDALQSEQQRYDFLYRALWDRGRDLAKRLEQDLRTKKF